LWFFGLVLVVFLCIFSCVLGLFFAVLVFVVIFRLFWLFLGGVIVLFLAVFPFLSVRLRSLHRFMGERFGFYIMIAVFCLYLFDFQ
jgi:hypothetical protein